MATTSLTIGNELLSTTMHVLMEDWRDSLHEKTAFLDAHERVHGAGKPVQDGGTRIVVPLGFNEHSSPTRMQTGYERIDLSVTDVFVPAVYDWGHVLQPVVIAAEEEFNNRGQEAVISIVEARTKAVANATKRQFVRQIVAGGETGWDDWNSLNGIDTAVAGFLEENAVAMQGNTVGGVSKSTYSSKPGWQNQIYDGSASFNSNGLAGLYDLMVEIDSVSDEKIDCILASRSGFKNLKRALQAQERYVSQDKIDGGRIIQLWDGVQIDVERNMPDSGSQSATDPASFYFLNLHDIHCIFSPGGYFELTDFETVSGEFDVRSAKLRIRGQLIAKKLGSSGLGFDLETF